MAATVKRFSDKDKAGFWEKLLALPLAEKILGPIALLVVIGWLISGSGFSHRFPKEWFATASFLSALAIATLIVLKVFGKRPLPEHVERYSIAIVSLLPILGFLISSLKSVPYFLTVGGSMALAYVSASVYWRKHIPDLGEKIEEKEAAAPKPEDSEDEPASGEESKKPAEGDEQEKPEPPVPAGEGEGEG